MQTGKEEGRQVSKQEEQADKMAQKYGIEAGPHAKRKEIKG